MIDPKWVLRLMLAALDAGPAPEWRPTFERTADAIALVAERRPLFSGPDAAAKTAALIVSVAWFEGTLKPDAEGDHECLERDAQKRCTKKGEPRSFCTMQVHRSNFGFLGVTREQLQTDIVACVDAGSRMMVASFKACADKPRENRLDQYAVGGVGCVRPWRDEGAHRIRKGDWLFANVRP